MLLMKKKKTKPQQVSSNSTADLKYMLHTVFFVYFSTFSES